LAALIEFVFHTKIRDTYDICATLSSTLTNRLYLSDNLFKKYIHSLTQHIFTEAFYDMANKQQLLMGQNRTQHNMIEIDIGDCKILVLEVYVHGLLIFASIPDAPEIGNPMLEIVGHVVRSPCAATLIPAIADRLLHTNNEFLVNTALQYLPLDSLLISIMSFGLSPNTVELIYKKNSK
jgi:hypothetical protein